MPNFFFDPNELAGKKIVKQTRNFLVDPCRLCGLYKHCQSPKMVPFGKNGKRILIIGEAPGKIEDLEGIQFVGRSGKLLRNALRTFDINMDKDCARTNVQQCFVSGAKFLPEKTQFCYDRLEQQIKEYKPKLIMCFGQEASKRIIEDHDIVPGLSGDAFGLVRGDVYPVRKYGCWVSLNYHPAYILRNRDILDLFYDDLAFGLNYLEEPFPKSMLKEGKNIFVGKKPNILKLLQEFSRSGEVSIDYETNQINPFIGNPELLYMSLSRREDIGYVIKLKPKDMDVFGAVSKFLRSKSGKIAQNGKFEENWSQVIFGHGVKNWVGDTILSAHITDERRHKKSLAFLAYKETGDSYKDLIDVKNIENEPLDKVTKYSGLDARFPILIHKKHRKIIEEENLKSAYKFLLEGNKALSRLEQNGIKIDLEAYKKFKKETERKREQSLKIINESEFVSDFKSKYRKNFNPASDEDLAKVFFEILDCEPVGYTVIKRTPQVNDEFFESLDETELSGFVNAIRDFKGHSKMTGTYIKSIVKYVDKNGFLHPNYNLWVAETIRSSCDSPNLQNVPTRDEEQREFRKIFIPRYDFLLDADHKGSEVAVQAMLANDKRLIAQLKSGVDPHRYWASRLYQKDESKITKKERDAVKGDFVFALLYGSYYVHIAQNLGLSERHVKKCQDEFYRFYNGIQRWQEDKIIEYEENGFVSTPLGFRRRATLSRNQIVNTPVQGTSFHYLLDTLIRTIIAIDKYKMKSLPVLQVHDNILFDEPEKEIDNLTNIVNEISHKKTYWKWTRGLPITIDWEIGQNLYEMEKLK